MQYGTYEEFDSDDESEYLEQFYFNQVDGQSHFYNASQNEVQKPLDNFNFSVSGHQSRKGLRFVVILKEIYHLFGKIGHF